MSHLTQDQASALARTAAHTGMSSAQLEAVLESLGHGQLSTITQRALRAYRLRLEWIARGYQTGEEAATRA
jgi:DNA-binding phage protein